MRFSQKIGITSIRESFQFESIDQRLENKLWNNILQDFFEPFSSYDSDRREICKIIWLEFYFNRIDQIPSFSSGGVYAQGVIKYIEEWYFESEWYEKYDLIEFLSSLVQSIPFIKFTHNCNKSLKEEMSAYRIVDCSIVEITSDEEIVEIETAIQNSSEFNSVNTHLKAAIKFLSDRENPDYRNSVKESISAVESFCCIITENNNATLGNALKKIEEKFKIHKALKNAFSSIYGYTSDSGGIRHSLLEDDIPVTKEDAQFMLISCSAFINYLKSKIE
ncbi:AbiJ-NTD4 domain-containing protein [Christiangramia echinicola]|uniref:HEPN AbiJ-N-terminal domain-containing protein n=1 Tax=Christiangramia echinicola TaxID=279359 RepID=A0A1H1LB43_9FLAO|nr:hypothetical protein [Christiangramia echinicola]SDR71542.1 hypothetical protein SAMN04488552_0667 [Christiangramia echinicola]